jgi:hypothetical protein
MLGPDDLPVFCQMTSCLLIIGLEFFKSLYERKR